MADFNENREELILIFAWSTLPSHFFSMTETLAHGYSSESTQQELSNEYQHDRVSMVSKNLCNHVLWAKVAWPLEGLKHWLTIEQEVSGDQAPWF